MRGAQPMVLDEVDAAKDAKGVVTRGGAAAVVAGASETLGYRHGVGEGDAEDGARGRFVGDWLGSWGFGSGSGRGGRHGHGERRSKGGAT